jgi:hypothetical protein
MNRKGALGQAIASPFAIIVILVLSIIFVFASLVLAEKNEQSYSLLKDFLDDYIIYEGKKVTVNEALNKFCVSSTTVFGRDPAKLREALRKHFIEEYGLTNHFAFTHKFMFDERIYFSSFPAGEFEVDKEGDLYIEGENGVKKFRAFFDPELRNVEKRYMCGEDILYTRGGLYE